MRQRVVSNQEMAAIVLGASDPVLLWTDGTPVKVGDRVSDYRGNKGKGWITQVQTGPIGRVQMKFDNGDSTSFPVPDRLSTGWRDDDRRTASEGQRRKDIKEISEMLAKATSLEQLRRDFADAVAKSQVYWMKPSVSLMAKAEREQHDKDITDFSTLLARATSLDQLRKDFADAVARADGSTSFLTRKYGGVPVWGWGAIGVGGLTFSGVLLKLLLGGRRR